MEKKLLASIIVLCFLASFSIQASASKYFDLKWNYTAKGKVTAAYVDDLDGDGFKDIVAASTLGDLSGNTGWILLLSKEGALRWSVVAEGAVSALTVTDLEGDGKKEAIAGVSSGVFFYDGEGMVSKKFLESIYKAQEIIPVDLNSDGKKELVVAGTSSDGGKVFAFDQSKRVIFSSTGTRGSLTCAHVSDLDGNGLKEIVVGTVGKYDDYPGYVHMYTSEGKEAWVIKTEKGVRSVSSYDFDGDGTEEILVGGKDFFYLLDKNGAVKKNVSISGRVNRIALTDLDLDGKKEILLGSTQLYVLDENLAKKWVANTLYYEIEDIKTFDINDDGFLEIVVAAKNLFFFDKEGREVDRYTGLNQYFYAKTIEISDLTGDDYPELIVSSLDASIHVLWSQIQSKRMDASRFYNKAKTFYEKRDYDAAEENAREAKKLYTDIPDQAGIDKSMKLLSDIVNAQVSASDIKTEAEILYDAAYSAFVSEDYINASSYASQAKAKYQSPELNNAEGVNKCNQIITTSNDYVRINAGDMLADASAAVEQKDYAKALASAEKAFAGYKFLRDDEGMAKSAAIASESREALGIKEDSSFIPDLDTGTLVVIAVAVLAVSTVLVVVIKVRSSLRRKRSPQASEERSEARINNAVPRKGASGKMPISLAKERKEESVLGVIEDIDRDKSLERHSHRKHLPKISKDMYRGVGLSLSGLLKREEQDVSTEVTAPSLTNGREEDLSD